MESVQQRTFMVKPALRAGWEIFRKNIWYFIGLFVIYIGVQMIFSGLLQVAETDDSPGGVLLATVISIVVQIILNLGTIKIALGFVDGNKLPFSTLFKTIKPFWKAIGASILVGIITMVGFVLLVVPGVIAAIGLQFFLYFIVDKNMKPVEALRASWELTKGNKWKLFGFALIAWLINVGGVLLAGVGVLVTVPITLLALAHIFRQLQGKVKNIAELSSQPAVPTTVANSAKT